MVPGTDPGVVAGDETGEINVDSEVTEDPAGLDIGGMTLIVGGCEKNQAKDINNNSIILICIMF